MGVATSCGCGTRLVAPLIATYMYSSVGPRWTFLLLIGFCCIAIVLMLVMYKRLVPYNEYVKTLDNNLEK